MRKQRDGGGVIEKKEQGNEGEKNEKKVK